MTALSKASLTCRDHPHVVRSVRIGGFGRLELLAELQRNQIELNKAGLELFGNDKFITYEGSSQMLELYLGRPCQVRLRPLAPQARGALPRTHCYRPYSGHRLRARCTCCSNPKGRRIDGAILYPQAASAVGSPGRHWQGMSSPTIPAHGKSARCQPISQRKPSGVESSQS